MMDMKLISVIATIVLGSYLIHQTSGQDDTKPASERVAEGIRRLSFNLLQELAKKESGNLLFSPLSIGTALGMLQIGAAEKTLLEIQNVLGISSISIDGFEEILRKAKNDAPLISSNAAFIDKRLHLKPQYVAGLMKTFSAEQLSVDFQNAEEAVSAVNGWVSANTGGRIKDLLDKGAVESSTSLIVANALYFKGQWTESFNKSYTRPGLFYLDSVSNVTVPLMYTEKEFPYANVKSLETLALEMPYEKEGRYKMLLLIPELGKMDKLISEMNSESLQKIQESLKNETVPVLLPRFKIKKQKKLREALTKLGVSEAFTPVADLSGISQDKLYVSDVVHQAELEVDEEGTVASASTAALVHSYAAGPFFAATRPFLFFVIDSLHNVPVFIGRLSLPSSE